MSLFEQIMIGSSPQSYIPSFMTIGPLVGEKLFEGFYLIWAWWSSWSCDLDPTNKLSFPHLMDAPHEIWLQLAQWFERRRCLKNMTDDRLKTTAIEAGHTIGSPWAKGSDELISYQIVPKYHTYYNTCPKFNKICYDTQEMPQSQSTTLLRH